ncbi:MAG: potassium channel family protein [Spirochaetales bacterium]|nr:potassium channel family protein [Spirochaetales bacterium]
MEEILSASERKILYRIYNILSLFLCLYVLVEISLEVVIKIPSNIQERLDLIDLAICIFFLMDWFFFFFMAKDKKKYFKIRFIDLIASIPFVQLLRPFRIFRTLRLIRLLRLAKGFKGINALMRIFFRNPARSALSLYSVLTIIIYFYCSLGLYTYEKEVNQAISNFGDVLWLSFTTLTTVGYGDIYPITTGGRIFAAILVITGMGLFGLITAEIATIFIKFTKKDNE